MGLAAAGLRAFLADERPPDDTDLRSYRRVVKEDENGFRLVDGTQVEVVWPTDEGEEQLVEANSLHFDRRKASEIAAQNAPAFEKVDLALEKRDFQLDLFEDLEAPVPHLLAWTRMAAALASRSRLRIEEGRPEDAYEDALRLIRLGSRIQGAQGILIEFATGGQILEMGNERLARMAVQGQLPVRVLRRSIADLAPGMTRRSLADSLRAEYVLIAGTLDRFIAEGRTVREWARAQGFHQRSSMPNRTKRLLAGEIRKLIELDALSPSVRKTLEPSNPDAGFLDSLLFGRPGKHLILGIACERAMQSADTAPVHMALTRLLLAIAAYREEAGALPDSLQSLAPGYLDAIPLDPCTRKEFRYSPGEAMLHSTGADGIDAGGSRYQDGWKALTDPDEPTLRLNPDAWKL